MVKKMKMDLINSCMRILIILAIILTIMLSSIKITINTKKHQRTITFNGLLWVALDYYTIIKYNSKDIPMKIISIKKNDDTPMENNN